MKTGILLAASILLTAMAAGPALAAEDAAQLPDLSRALQARIDGRISAVLDHSADGDTLMTSAGRTTSTDLRTGRETASPSARTDERGWKPYHSAM